LTLPTHLTALAERARAALEGDRRVRAVWLTGSIAAGRADAYSDLDLRLAVQDEGYDGFVAGWEEVVERISPTVLRRRLPGGDVVITAVTPEWLRFDLHVLPVATALARPSGPVGTLFDRDGLTARLPAAPPAAPPSTERLVASIEEFLRVLGLLPVVVGREEYLVAGEGAWLLRRMLIDLMILANGPDRRGGVKRLNPFLTAEQRRVLESLPPIAPTRQSAIEGSLACAAAYLPLARRLAAEHGGPYPEALEAATFAYLERTLGVRP
jgi:hypothetical protein